MNRQKNRVRFLAGNYTMEAAFLVPIILGIFFAWLFQLFYLHDQVVTNGMLQEAAIERTEDGCSVIQKDGENRAGEQREKIQSHLWIMKISVFRIKKEVSGTKYVLQSETVWDIPVMRQYLKNHFIYRTEIKTKDVHPETFMRLTKTKEG